MSHFIDQTAREAGAAYYAGEPAWHGLGTVTKEAKTSREVIHLAGMDWEVEKVPHYFNWEVSGMDGEGNPYTEMEKREVPNSFLTVRNDTGAVLGVGVTDKYTVVNNRDAFDFMDALVAGDAGADVRYESAGSLKDGRLIWVLARVGEAKFVCDGDPQIPYVLLSTTHDGTGSVRIQGTPVRVVCWNTLTLAQRKGKRHEISHYSIRHVGDLQERVEEARKAIGLAIEGFDQYVETGSRLAEVPVNESDSAKVSAFMKAVFPKQLEKEDPSTRIQNIVERIMRNWHEDPRQTEIAGAKGTAWGLLNATTQYFDHDRTTKTGEDDDKRNENLAYGSWFGEPAKAKARAFEAAENIFLDEKTMVTV